MHTGTTYILTEEDDADEPASSNVISFLDYFIPVGEDFDLIVTDLAVRMSGQFDLPRLTVLAAREETSRQHS
jgi:hypothetical protein